MSLTHADFRSPWWMPGGHMQTLLPVIMRPVVPVYESLSIDFPDGDRLAADFYPAVNATSKKLLIVTHGLEGHSRQHYVSGMCRTACNAGFDVLAWNLRGCGPIDNILPKLYYSGCSEDLDVVIDWAAQRGYINIYLAGYSLGGNVVLKWAGEQGAAVKARGVKSVCTASVPVDLKGCVDTLDHWKNIIYRHRFVTDMKKRLRAKAKKFPAAIDLKNLPKVKTLRDYDELFSAPLNGFGSADELHVKCSAKNVLHKLALPTLLINANNDPFLSDSCYPRDIAQEHSLLTFEPSATGGHVGYLSHRNEWWLDQRFLDFFAQNP